MADELTLCPSVAFTEGVKRIQLAEVIRGAVAEGGGAESGEGSFLRKLLSGGTLSLDGGESVFGTVLGYSCVTQIGGGCQNQVFIWTPSTANGISGTTVAIPVPTGFVGCPKSHRKVRECAVFSMHTPRSLPR